MQDIFSSGPSITSKLSLLDQICSPLDLEDLEEEVYDDNSDLITLLSPNSKASALFPRSKRIHKKPLNSEETLKNSKKTSSKSRQTRKAWTVEEDKKLLQLYREYGNSWSKIASNIKDRNGKQVRDRYLNVLVSNINRGTWTEEEDRMILKIFDEKGARWCEISDSLQGRTEIQVKNRYYSYLKKPEKKSNAKDQNEGNHVEEMTTEASPDANDPAQMMISYEGKRISFEDLFVEEEI